MRLTANMVCLIFLKRKMYSHLQVIISLRFQIKKPTLFTHVYIKDLKVHCFKFCVLLSEDVCSFDFMVVQFHFLCRLLIKCEGKVKPFICFCIHYVFRLCLCVCFFKIVYSYILNCIVPLMSMEIPCKTHRGQIILPLS